MAVEHVDAQQGQGMMCDRSSVIVIGVALHHVCGGWSSRAVASIAAMQQHWTNGAQYSQHGVLHASQLLVVVAGGERGQPP